MSLTKTAAGIREALIGKLGMNPSASRAALALGGGGLAGAASTPYVTPEDWASANKLGKLGLIIQNAALGGAGALTGSDRFGLLGALGGLGAAGGISRLISKVKPTGDEVSDYLGRASLEGLKGSLSGSLMFSSMMKGSGLRALVKKILEGAGGKRLMEEVREGVHMGADPQIHMGPGSFISKMVMGKDSPGPIAKWYDWVAGSPYAGKAVNRYGDIPSIPASDYLKAQATDVLGGAGAGLLMAPLAAVGGALGHQNQEELAKQQGIIPYLRYKIDKARHGFRQ